MNVVGIGTDSVEVGRIRRAVERTGERFLKRVFTESEQACCNARRDRFACYAARFAAKEAVLKAIGTGLAGCRWTDIEIRRRLGDRPEVVFSGRAAELARRKEIAGLLVSFSHDRERAVAFALATGAEGFR